MVDNPPDNPRSNPTNPRHCHHHHLRLVSHNVSLKVLFAIFVAIEVKVYTLLPLLFSYKFSKGHCIICNKVI